MFANEICCLLVPEADKKNLPQISQITRIVEKAESKGQRTKGKEQRAGDLLVRTTLCYLL